MLEYETDWKEVMKIILECFETFPTDKEAVEKMGQDKLEEWTLTQEGGDELELKVKIIISEMRYYQENRKKSLRLVFNDMYETVVRFHVTKKRLMRPLKSISAEALSSKLTHSDDIYELEVPKELFDDIETVYNDIWRDKHITHMAMSQFLQMPMDIQE